MSEGKPDSHTPVAVICNVSTQRLYLRILLVPDRTCARLRSAHRCIVPFADCIREGTEDEPVFNRNR